MVRAGCAATTCALAPRPFTVTASQWPDHHGRSRTYHSSSLKARRRQGRRVTSTRHCRFLIGATAIRNGCNHPENSILIFSDRPKVSSPRSYFAPLASLLSIHFSSLPEFLIGSRPLLEFGLTHSQQTRNHFLIASFSATFSGFARIAGSRSTNLAQSPAELSPYWSPSDADDGKARECGTIHAGVEREQAVTIAQGVSPDQEIGENAAGGGTLVALALRSVGLKRATGRSPHGFVQFPFNCDARLPEKRIKESFAAARKREKLGINWGGDDQRTPIPRGGERGLRQRIQGIACIPISDEHIAVNRGSHRPRSWRIARTMALRPEGIPGLPIPRYFSKGLLARKGLTRNSDPSCSKTNLSPGRTPSARRTSWGTVIWPLLVIRAFFFRATFAIPYFSTCLLTFASGKRANFQVRLSCGQSAARRAPLRRRKRHEPGVTNCESRKPGRRESASSVVP
jgi:hypothetical protein